MKHGATDGKHQLAGKFSHLFPAVISTSEKESIKATLSHVSTCIFWAAGLVIRALSKALLTFTSFQKINNTHSSGTLGLLSLIVIIETFLVIYGTRGLLGITEREQRVTKSA